MELLSIHKQEGAKDYALIKPAHFADLVRSSGHAANL